MNLFPILNLPGALNLKPLKFETARCFFATLTGPGVVAIQSLPFSRLADRILSHTLSQGGKRKGEGSVLGGLGDLLDGDIRF